MATVNESTTLEVNESTTFEEAEEATNKALALAADPSRINVRTLPIYKWAVMERLKTYRKAYESGNKFALMAAIRECARCDLPLPDWVATAYIRAYDTVLNARAKSWDDVFGRPYPKGVHLNAVRKRRELKFAVYNEIKLILNMNPDTPIDESLFECVGKKFGIGKTLASELYYSVKRLLSLPDR